MSLEQRVNAFAARLSREDVNMHGFLLSVDGVEKVKAYYGPFREGQPHRLYSVSKTMTGLAVGILCGDGRLKLEQPITDFFADWLGERPPEWLMALTIRDMLRMATCYQRTTYREGVDENWAKTFFTAAPTHAPGTVFHYDTSCSQVLAALVRRLSGQEVIAFLNARLFAPLGLQDERFWLTDPSGCCTGGTGLCMSLRDMHRVAECVLRGGEGLIPAWYCENMTRKQIDTPLQTNEEERYGYGWQCWRTRAGWSMYGLGGQLAVVCPDKRAVLSTIADTRLDPFGVQRIYNAFFEELYPYLGAEDMAPVSLRLPLVSLPDQPEFAREETPAYRFADGNQLQLRTLRLTDGCLVYENARGVCRLPFGRGEALTAPYPGWDGVPAAVSGGWLAPGTLRVRCSAIGKAPCGFEMLLCFQGGEVTVQCRRSGDPVTEGYDGVATGKAE